MWHHNFRVFDGKLYGFFVVASSTPDSTLTLEDDSTTSLLFTNRCACCVSPVWMESITVGHLSVVQMRLHHGSNASEDAGTAVGISMPQANSALGTVLDRLWCTFLTGVTGPG